MKENRLNRGWQAVFSGFPQSRGIPKFLANPGLARTLIGTAKKQGWGVIQSLMRDPSDLIKELRTV